MCSTPEEYRHWLILTIRFRLLTKNDSLHSILKIISKRVNSVHSVLRRPAVSTRLEDDTEAGQQWALKPRTISMLVSSEHSTLGQYLGWSAVNTQILHDIEAAQQALEPRTISSLVNSEHLNLGRYLGWPAVNTQTWDDSEACQQWTLKPRTIYRLVISEHWNITQYWGWSASNTLRFSVNKPGTTSRLWGALPHKRWRTVCDVSSCLSCV